MSVRGQKKSALVSWGEMNCGPQFPPHTHVLRKMHKASALKALHGLCAGISALSFYHFRSYSECSVILWVLKTLEQSSKLVETNWLCAEAPPPYSNIFFLCFIWHLGNIFLMHYRHLPKHRLDQIHMQRQPNNHPLFPSDWYRYFKQCFTLADINMTAVPA